MKELLRTDNPVLLSYILSLLNDEEIEAYLADQYTSMVGIVEQRILVKLNDYDKACFIIRKAGHEPFSGEDLI